MGSTKLGKGGVSLPDLKKSNERKERATSEHERVCTPSAWTPPGKKVPGSQGGYKRISIASIRREVKSSEA